MNNVLIGLNIKAARKRKRMTQRELADHIGKVESSIRKYEKGEVEVPNSVLEQIASTLDTTLSELIGIAPSNDERWNFEKYLESIGYKIFRDDPEHKPFLSTPYGTYRLEYGDLEHFREVSEAYLKYTIDSTLKSRKND